MNKAFAHPIYSQFLTVIVFLATSFLLTYNVVAFPSLVIGDNLYWTAHTTIDIFGQRLVRESFLGDVAILSTFKNGFLLPLTYTFNLLNLPTGVIYPFLLYFLSMLSFFFLAIEFLRTKLFSVLVSIVYVANPVVPYYFASLQNVFVLIFLPLTLKFFVRSLREVEQPDKSSLLSKNFVLGAFFLAMSVSAHEQFFLSAGLIALFFVVTYGFVCLRKYGRTTYFIKFIMINFLLFFAMFALINMPLLLSLSNASNSPSSSYFTGRPNDFLANVRYTYSTADLTTLLRFGGDSGVGLGRSAWYDSNSAANLLGYSTFIIFVASVLLLIFRRETIKKDRAFFYMNILMFASTLSLVLFIKYLPSNRPLLEVLFSFALQTWESPAKIRVLLFLATLTTAIITFKWVENLGGTTKRRIFKGAFAMVFIVSILGYNSPWIIGYAGETPVKQVADNLGWGPLYDQQFSKIADLVEQNFSSERGLVIPYTYKEQLYDPPNFRLFQIISVVNGKMMELTQGPDIPWSKVLGLLSAKTVILKDHYEPNETLIFPNYIGQNFSDTIGDIQNDPGLILQERLDNFSILKNQNALPILYASRYYVFYDDIATLTHALHFLNMSDLPVLIESGSESKQLRIPDFVGEDVYRVYALRPHDASLTEITLLIKHGDNSASLLNLNKTLEGQDVDVFSALSWMRPGDAVMAVNPSDWRISYENREVVLDSTSLDLGRYEKSFRLNFTVEILREAAYEFLGPRVIIDAGNSREYFLVFHEDGVVELALLSKEGFTSGLLYGYGGYNLKLGEHPIEVSVSRIFDQIEVDIDGGLTMAFSIKPSELSLSLSSELSESKFTDVKIETKDTLRLFAARQITSQPAFQVQSTDSTESRLLVSNGGSDYAIVDQYLNTPLRYIIANNAYCPVTANILFSGWIIDNKNGNTGETSITIKIRNSQLAFGLTFFSIISAYMVLLAAFAHRRLKRTYAYLSKLLFRRQRHSENDGVKTIG